MVIFQKKAIERGLLLDKNNYVYANAYSVNVDKKLRYNPDSVLVGYTNHNKYYRLDLRTGIRVLLLGLPGTGKTFLFQSLVDRIYASDKYHIVYLSDIKNEFAYSNKVVQQRFWKNNHVLNEKPKALPILAFKPNYFKNFNVEIPKGQYGFGFRLQDLQETDWKEITGFEKFPPVQRVVLQKIISKIISGVFKTGEEIKVFIDEIEGIDKNSRVTFWLKLEPLFTSGFFSKPHIDFVKLLQKNYVLTFNLQFFNNIGRDSGLPQSTITILRRMFSNAKIKKVLRKRLLLVLDESNRWVPDGRSTTCKIEIFEGVEIERADRIEYFFAYQQIGSVPDEIIENCRFIFIPQAAPVEAFVKAFKSVGYSGAAVSLKPRINRLKREMRRFHKFSWCVFDRTKNGFDVVAFFSPMSFHKSSN